MLRVGTFWEGSLDRSAKSGPPEIDWTVALKSVPDQVDSCSEVEPLAIRDNALGGSKRGAGREAGHAAHPIYELAGIGQ